MISFPNAKINIGLNIISKRQDGFHNLETIFYPLPDVRDVLEILPSSKDEFHSIGLTIPGMEDDNLILKALKLLRIEYSEARNPVKILLYKNIPMGAGLGGGSADGAFALIQFNKFFNLGLSNEKLEEYALELGSDCPFFIKNKPSFATSRGELLNPVSLNLDNYSIQLICPEVHISTADAFAGVIPSIPPQSIKDMINLPITDWKEFIKNDFEQPVFNKFPILGNIKDQLYEQGAIYASLSGTGSTVYGIFYKNDYSKISISSPYIEFLV